MTLEPTDQFVVQRDGAMKNVESQNLQASLRDTDLMVVARGTTPYKATGKEIKDSLAPADLPPTISSISLAGGPGFSGKSYVTTLNAFEGIPTASKSMKAKVTGELSIAGETSPITDVGEPGIIWSDASNLDGATRPKTLAFDGDLSTSCSPGVDATKRTVIGNSITINSEFAYYSPNTVGQNTSFFFTRDDGTVKAATTQSADKVDDAFTVVTLPSGWTLPFTCTKIEAQRVKNSESIAAYRVDDTVLIDNVLTLTLTDRTNLDNGAFVVGDVVTGYTESGGPPAAFAPVIYTGNGAARDIDCGLAPDFVWIKARTSALSSCLFDSVRGVQQALISDDPDAENDYSPNYLSSFNSNGFSLGGPGGNANTNGVDYVAWCWKASGSTVTNNEGTIASQVRAGNGFSIVKYTGTSEVDTVGHGLGKSPSLIIIKDYEGVNSLNYNWQVYSSSVGNTNSLLLNTNAAQNDYGAWNNTTPTADVFTLGAVEGVNRNGNNHIAYCFAETPGVSSFGKYTGNGNSDGPVIDCGGAPALVMVKRTTDSGNWIVVDTARDNGKELYWDLANVESSASYRITITDTGFQLTSSNANVNGDGSEYIYAAFAAGDPPVTVEAISTTAAQMTVSGGDWENGQTVKNTVVNPQTGVPKSDVIVGVGTDTQSVVVAGIAYDNVKADIEAGVATGLPNTGNADMAQGTPISDNIKADGTVITANICPNDIIGGATTAVFTYDPPIATTGSLNVYGGVRSNAALTCTKTVTYSDGTSDTQTRDSGQNDWYWVNTFATNSKSVSSVSVNAPNDTVVGGVTLGDNNLILASSFTALTLDSSDGLGNFAPGYDVYQDSGYTAETSEITGVDATTQPEWSANWTRAGGAGDPVLAFNGDVQSGCQIDDNSGTQQWAGFNISPPITGSVIRIWCQSVAGGVATTNNLRINGSAIYTAPYPGRPDDNYDPIDISETSISSIQGLGYAGGGTYVSGIEVDGVLLIDNFPSIELTLTDDTDLDVFEPGDVLQGIFQPSSFSNPANFSDGNSGARGTWADIQKQALGETWSQTGNNWMYTNPSTSAAFDYTGEGVIRLYCTVTAAGSAPVAVRGDVVEADTDVDFPTVATAGGSVAYVDLHTTAASGRCQIVTRSGQYIYWFSIGDAQDAVSITAVGPGNTMTVDGGTWTEDAGQTVSCTYEPGTGTVGSTSDSTMTLSTADNAYPKRWVAGKQKFVTGDPTAIKSKSVFLEFTGSTVDGTSPTDPGFTPAPANLTLSFNDASNPSGRTWDQDFPAGTKIETQVRLTNDSAPGGVDSGWSNEVIARKLSTDLSEQELQQAYAETAASLLSHKNRGDYRTGQEALEKRADLRIKMSDLGLTKDQIKELGLE